jgi:plasmid maintenance system antidote protein VapI
VKICAKPSVTEEPDAGSQGLSRKDLIPLIGSRARVSEILNKKRTLSINMIRKPSRRSGDFSRDINKTLQDTNNLKEHNLKPLQFAILIEARTILTHRASQITST